MRTEVQVTRTHHVVVVRMGHLDSHTIDIRIVRLGNLHLLENKAITEGGNFPNQGRGPSALTGELCAWPKLDGQSVLEEEMVEALRVGLYQPAH